MNIEFSDAKMAELFNTEKRLCGRYGAELAKAIMKRLSQAHSATCLEDLRNLPGHWHNLEGDYADCVSARLSGNWRLILRAAPPIPRKPDGGLNWKEVVTLRFVDVKDYH